MTSPSYQLFRGQLPMFDGQQRAFGLLRCSDAAGHEGWGEIAPLSGFSSDSLDEALQEAIELLQQPDGRTPTCPSLAWAVDTAQLNLEAAQKNIPLCQLMRAAAPRHIAINALLMPDEPISRDRTYPIVKCKVGARPIAEEADRLRKVPVRLRLDANRSLSLGQALTLSMALSELDVEYIEEPVKAFEDLPAFIEQSHFPVALDETLREKTSAELAHLDLGAIVYKPSLMGSWIRLMHWHEFAVERGIEMTISAAYETGIGLWNLANVAAGLSNASPYAGLDTYRFLAEDLLDPRLDFSEGRLDLSSSFATAYRVNTELLEEIPHG
ncbi:MAG: O-succinylbenzoate synthase [Kiritimatiellia bacterium]|jgi:O-succinylbenzoate synthase